MEAICCECGKRLDFFKSYAFTKPSGETVLGHKDCVKAYAEKYKNKYEQDEKEMKYTIKDLDKKVNNDETLFQYIQMSFKEFYDDTITKKDLEDMTEEELNMLIEELDDLWAH